jgi:hypothetical protein
MRNVEIISKSKRIDGMQYLVKVPEAKIVCGYDLVTVFISHNGMRHFKSANCSRTTPFHAGAAVTKHLATGG